VSGPCTPNDPQCHAAEQFHCQYLWILDSHRELTVRRYEAYGNSDRMNKPVILELVCVKGELQVRSKNKKIDGENASDDELIIRYKQLMKM